MTRKLHTVSKTCAGMVAVFFPGVSQDYTTCNRRCYVLDVFLAQCFTLAPTSKHLSLA